MSKIFVKQSALRITLKTFTDLEEVLFAVIKYRKPNGKIGEFSAAVGDPVKGVLFHECLENEIDTSGWWFFWAFITFSDGRSAAGEAAKVYVWCEGK
jgi:hypothetical protein